MELYSNQIFHIYNRGNNSRKVFFTEANYLYFLRKVKKHLAPHCDVLSWCLMPNHFHFIVFINSKQGPYNVSKAFQIILSSYAKGVNKQENFTGSIFQQRTKSKPLVNEVLGNQFYPKNCFNYIHQNPVSAGLVERKQDWGYSSFREFLGLSDFGFLNKSLAHELIDFPKKVKDFYSFSNEVIAEEFEKSIDWEQD